MMSEIQKRRLGRPPGEPDTRVVFRVFRDGTGDALALFPDIVEPHGMVSSYMHVGQHSAANYGHCIRISRPATPAESAPLLRELESIGYRLREVSRRQIKRRR